MSGKDKKSRWWIFWNIFKLKIRCMIMYIVLLPLGKMFIEDCWDNRKTNVVIIDIMALLVEIFCLCVTFYDSRGYFIDLLINKVVKIEGPTIKKIGILAPGRGTHTVIGERRLIETPSGKRIRVDLLDSIEKESKRKFLWKSGTDYKEIYHCLMFCKIVLEVEYIPIV